MMFSGGLILLIFLLGVWGVLAKRNVIKKVMALNIINSAVIMAFIYIGSLPGGSAPILVEGVTEIVDPIPQALMLTAIVVGICTTALALTFVYKMYQKYHSLDIAEIERHIRHDPS